MKRRSLDVCRSEGARTIAPRRQYREDNANEADAAVVLVGESLSDIAPSDII